MAPWLFLAVLAGAAPRSDAFVVKKNENRNEVHYAVELDTACSPVGEAPVTPYWRMVEKGNVEEALLSIEQQAYGLAWQNVLDRSSGGSVRMALRAAPDRMIRIDTWPVPGGCAVRASTTIDGRAAFLEEVDVTLGLFGPGRIEILGTTREGGKPVREVLP